MADKNYLFYGDNLNVLRQHFKDETVDLIYLDPPFKSSESYNVLFKEHHGAKASAQVQAFEDTWEWNESAEEAHFETVQLGGHPADFLVAMRGLLGNSDMMAYLSMMAPRLIEMRRVLKGSGSIYLHCDPTASHYLKLLMDAVFRPENFRNEIVWKRYSGHGNVKRRFGSVHDILLFYVKGEEPATWTPQYGEYSEEYIEQFFRHEDEKGYRYRIQNVQNPNTNRPNLRYEWNGHVRVWKWTKEKMQELHDQGKLVYSSTGFPGLKQYLHESKGPVLQDVWTDVPALQNRTAERLGYQTQKPEALLERIIRASSEEGQVVLDPFCGCGTTVAVAERLKRRWMGIDVTHLAIGLMKKRLADSFPTKPPQYEVIGEPTTLDDAKELAKNDPHQFEYWALDLVGARVNEKKKGADKGIDGRLYFFDEKKSNAKQVIFSVKSGKLKATDVRDLRGVIEREKAQIGVLLSLQEPTKKMRSEAASAGFYQPPRPGERYGKYKKHPRLQLLTVEELLNGATVDMPPGAYNVTTTRAQRAKQSAPGQGKLV